MSVDNKELKKQEAIMVSLLDARWKQVALCSKDLEYILSRTDDPLLKWVLPIMLAESCRKTYLQKRWEIVNGSPEDTSFSTLP